MESGEEEKYEKCLHTKQENADNFLDIRGSGFSFFRVERGKNEASLGGRHHEVTSHTQKKYRCRQFQQSQTLRLCNNICSPQCFAILCSRRCTTAHLRSLIMTRSTTVRSARAFRHMHLYGCLVTCNAVHPWADHVMYRCGTASLTHSLVYASLAYSLTHSLIHKLTHSLIHSYTHALTHAGVLTWNLVECCHIKKWKGIYNRWTAVLWRRPLLNTTKSAGSYIFILVPRWIPFLVV